MINIIITFVCDRCEIESEGELTSTNWGAIDFLPELKRLNWWGDENEQYCPQCTPEVKRVNQLYVVDTSMAKIK